MEKIKSNGIIIHSYADMGRGCINVIGRLEDGRSFAAVQNMPEQVLYFRVSDTERVAALVQNKLRSERFIIEDSVFSSFDGSECRQIRFASDPLGRARCQRLSALCASAHIEIFGTDRKPAVAWQIERGIRAGISIDGAARSGEYVDVVFPNPDICAASEKRAPITLLSFDIETGAETQAVRAIGISSIRISPDGVAVPFTDNRVVLYAGPWNSSVPPSEYTVVCSSYMELLKRFTAEIQRLDPDIITGWNIIDFDFPRLSAAFAIFGLPFTLGRSREPGKFFPAEDDVVADNEDGSIRDKDTQAERSVRKRSASVFLPGRQVIDALRLIRTNHEYFESYALDTVARAILGKGKLVVSSGEEKIEELDKLYVEEPQKFCDYCLNDAELVISILEKRDSIKHTIERAALTGSGIDKAWTSVMSFERVYAGALFARRILEPNADLYRRVSGAAGGTVLEPRAGLFSHVAVFDFRSLYPSVIRTFNIDPWTYEISLRRDDSFRDQEIAAPNGARFDRKPGILPELIAEYFNERTKALAAHDDGSAFVYKILMNSFYGVLGTASCRYARTELAGAITSFGKYCLQFARDYFESEGFSVLYGDTDSVFVEMRFNDDISWEACSTSCSHYASELNLKLSEIIRTEYDVESFIGIRFEKMYRRFFIPRLRNGVVSRGPRYPGSIESHSDRGRAKGYAGYLYSDNGEYRVEVKGMEAARSDYTPLARRFQKELLLLAFQDGGVEQLKRRVYEEAIKLYRGYLDGELLFKKRLRRIPDAYTASTPPHVKVARDMGWHNRRGTVEYVWTVNGPESVTARVSPINYAYYAETQLLPTAIAIAEVAGFDITSAVSAALHEGQMEFDWSESEN